MSFRVFSIVNSQSLLHPIILQSISLEATVIIIIIIVYFSIELHNY